MKAVALCALALCCLGIPAAAQTKKAIKFTCNCTDPVGAAFATAFRDLLAVSPRYTEIAAATEKGPDGNDIYHFQVAAVTIDPSVGALGDSTVISVVFLVGDNYYFDNVVQTCNRAKIADCAANTIAIFDKDLNSGSK